MKFVGFSKEDFLVFPYGSRERKLEVKQKLYRFIKLVSKTLKDYDPEIYGRLAFIGVGYLKKDARSCWGYLSETKIQSNSAHFNFIIDDEGLSVGVQLERPTPVRRLIRNIKSDMSGFLRMLHDLEEDFMIRIYERIPEIGKDGEPLPRRFDWELLCTFQSKRFDRFALDYLLNKIERLEYSAISFRWQYYWTYQSELLNSDGIVDDAAEMITYLQPIYAFAIK
jgi:hypothetical protein